MTGELHLTPDDLDALLSGTPRTTTIAHLFDCPPCRAVATQDRRLVAALARLPRFDPAPDFADRVVNEWIAQTPALHPTTVPRSVLQPTPAWPFRRLAAAAAAILVVVSGFAGSMAWSITHRDLVLAWRERVLTWLASLPSAVEPPLTQAVTQVVESPLQAAAWALASLGLYVAGLLALRRLTALPPATPRARQALHAS